MQLLIVLASRQSLLKMAQASRKPSRVALDDTRIPHLVSCPALRVQEPIYDYTTAVLESLRIMPGVTAVCM